MKKFNLTRGLSLIEVLVTITITSIGLMGLVSLQMQAVKATSDSGNRSQAVWVFNDIINRIHANEDTSEQYINASLQGCIAPAATCSSYHSGNGEVKAIECNGTQLAFWDYYEVACKNTNVGIIGDSIDYLPNANLTIVCAGVDCDQSGSPLVITLEWKARADDSEITGATRNANSGLLTLTDVITP
jgi:type IV pilus assembly protein PilV